MTAELWTTGLFVGVLAYLLAPYWWRNGWWRIPREDMARPLRDRIATIERQMVDLEFDASCGKMTATDLATNTARRALERDRLLMQLQRLGGMAAMRSLPPPIRHDRRCEECGACCVAGTRFCAECGTPLKPRPVPPPSGADAKSARRKIIRLHNLWLMLLLCSPGLPAQGRAEELVPGDAVSSPGPNAAAMPPPHETMATGTIDGVLHMLDAASSRSVALPNHAYDIVVRLGEEEVVRVARRTNEAGGFVIKNIFPHEALRYFLEVTQAGQTLSSPPLQLAAGREQATVDVTVTPGGDAGATVTVGAATPVEPASASAVTQPPGVSPTAARWMSLLLCAIVAVGISAQIARFRRRAAAG